MCTNLTPNITAGVEWALVEQREICSSGYDGGADNLWTANRVLYVRWHWGRACAQTHRLACLKIVAAHPSPSVLVEGADLVDRDAVRSCKLRAVITWLHIVSIAGAVGIRFGRIIWEGAS
jgi:hypothetical protein